MCIEDFARENNLQQPSELKIRSCFSDSGDDPAESSSEVGLTKIKTNTLETTHSGEVRRVSFVFLDLRKFATTALETTTAVFSIKSNPQLFWLYGLRLVSAVVKLINVPISNLEARIVYILHRDFGFSRDVNEEHLFQRLLKECATDSAKKPTHAEFIEANNRLCRLSVIEICDGNLRLVDRVAVSSATSL